MIVNQELVKMVGSNTLFKGISKDFLKSFVKPKNYYGVKEGTIIYSKGDDSTNLYLIVEGEVKIKFCDKNKIEHKFITDFFGEEEILNKEIRASHAVANHDCILYKIGAEELNNLTKLNRHLADNLSNHNASKNQDLIPGSHKYDEGESLNREMEKSLESETENSDLKLEEDLEDQNIIGDELDKPAEAN